MNMTEAGPETVFFCVGNINFPQTNRCVVLDFGFSDINIA